MKLKTAETSGSVGISAAKDSFSTLLERVAHGETITITRRGVPVAILSPVPGSDPMPESPDVRETIRTMRQWQKEHGPTLGSDLTIREMIEAGRR